MKRILWSISGEVGGDWLRFSSHYLAGMGRVVGLQESLHAKGVRLMPWAEAPVVRFR